MAECTCYLSNGAHRTDCPQWRTAEERAEAAESRLAAAIELLRRWMADEDHSEDGSVRSETSTFLAAQPAAPDLFERARLEADPSRPRQEPGQPAAPAHADNCERVTHPHSCHPCDCQPPAPARPEECTNCCDICETPIDGDKAATSDICFDCRRRLETRTEAEQRVLHAMANTIALPIEYLRHVEKDPNHCWAQAARAELARREEAK